MFDEQKERAGKITSHGKYTVIVPCNDEVPSEAVRAFILFAGAEQIQNLCGLAQFSNSDPFFRTIIPGGPVCSTMIAFPAGMAENAPEGSAYVGSVDPTGNPWLPSDLIIMGIPAGLAQQMAADLEESFICKQSRIAYPENRILIKPPATDTPKQK
nr:MULTISPECIES: DUF169 domain-containing protein [unclassified Methanosarcina]